MLETQLQEPLRALEALHGVFGVGAPPDAAAEMRLATQRWLRSRRRPRDGLERAGAPRRRRCVRGARAQPTGCRAYRVVEAARAASRARDAAAGALADAAMTRSRSASSSRFRAMRPRSGSNALSLAGRARRRSTRAIESGRPTATAGVPLTPERRRAIAAWRSSSTRRSTTASSRAPPQRRAALRGLVFVAMTLDAQLGERSPARCRRTSKLCIVDADPLAGSRRLAGRAGCESVRAGIGHAYAARFRRPPVGAARASADPGAVPEASNRGAWVIAGRRPALGGDAGRLAR